MAQARAVLRLSALRARNGPLCLAGRFSLGVEPEVLRSRQGVDALGAQLSVLALAHGVDGFSHVLHDVESIEDDLVVRVVEVRLDRVDVGRPHVHGHGSDPGTLVGAEGFEVGIEAGLRAVVGDVLDGAAGDVIDERQVGVALALPPSRRRRSGPGPGVLWRRVPGRRRAP